MYVRKFIFLLLLSVLMCFGCVRQYNAQINQPDEIQIKSISEQTNKFTAESISISEPNEVLILRDVLSLTLIHNPELKAFSLETRAAQARQLQAGLWPNPEIELEIEELGGQGDRRGFDAAETTVQLSQLIELGDKSQKRKAVASFEKELADLDYQSKRLEIFCEATKAFIVVLKAQEKLRLSNDLLKLAEESLDTVKKIVDAGKDSPVEVTRASIALANIRISHSQAQRELEYSRKQLSSFWGQDEPHFEKASGDFESIEKLPESGDLTNQLKQNPEYVRWEAEVKKNQAQLTLEKSRVINDVTIGAGIQRFNETDDNSFVLGVSIPLPVSNRNQGARQEAVYNLAKSKEYQKAAWLKLQNELNEAYREFVNSYTQAISLKNEILPAAIEMFNASTTAYREGKVDYLHLLDAQQTFFDVKGQYIESLANYHKARTDIERLTGKRIETTNFSESEQ